MRPTSRFLIPCLILLSSVISAARAEMIKAHEPRYAQAVLAFNAKKYDEALKILDSLLSEAPQLIEFLELKALTLKSSKNDQESLKTYEALIKAKRKEGATPKSLAPYHFELGVLSFRTKKPAIAAPHFKYSIENDFNKDASLFFLGLISYQNADYPNAAAFFEKASKSSVNEIKSPASFYLAQTLMKQGDTSGALSSFSEARSASDGLEDETSKAIRKATDQVLAPLNQSKKFASIALSLAYDSNVQALPNSLDGTLAFNKGSIKNLLQAGFGYMSSPTNTFQWVPQYRLLYNYNFNRETREGEFLNQYVSLYLNRKPLEKSGYGFKIDASLTFQNQVDTTTDKGTYRIFSSTGSLGAYYRWRFGRGWNSNSEVSFGPQHYNTDSTLSGANIDQRRSGGLFSIRQIFSKFGQGKHFNPSFILAFIDNDADGNGSQAEFASRAGTATFVNTFQWNDRFRSSMGVSYSKTFYDRRSGFVRIDQNYSIQSEWTYQINPKWNWISDASLAYNQSNVTSVFEYRRWTVSSGLSYSFY